MKYNKRCINIKRIAIKNNTIKTTKLTFILFDSGLIIEEIEGYKIKLNDT